MNFAKFLRTPFLQNTSGQLLLEDAKKAKENAESTGFLSDGVFSDGLNSPECAKILMNYLKNLEKKNSLF